MITNKVLERIEKGEKALGLAMTQPSDELVEMAGRMGLDFVGFDGQHSPISPEAVDRLCRIADGFGITPIMRIPDHRESTILSYLDRGIRQITVPNLQTREQAEDLVRYSFFAPKGLRSETSLRVVFNRQGDRTQMLLDVNANTILVPQLESVTALENLDEILEVDGIDYFNGGVGDLAQSMGMLGGESRPQVQEVVDRAITRIVGAGRIAGVTAMAVKPTLVSNSRSPAREKITVWRGAWYPDQRA